MAARKLVTSAERLDLATELLQRARLADSTAGVWEAADMQWWSRMPRRSDPLPMPFWFDAHGPVAAVLLTDWTVTWGLDVLRVSPGAPSMEEIWPQARRLMSLAAHEGCEALVREDDDELVACLVADGFRPGSRAWVAWMDAAERPPVLEPPAGYALVDRTSTRGRAHPMAGRSGDAVEEGLRRCSLYDPALDLAIQTDDGFFAGYALFWADPVTGVGLLEPMRVEDAHARRGLARALLAEGLERLARRGMTRLKVGFESDAARALYVGAGFRPEAELRTYAASIGAGSEPN